MPQLELASSCLVKVIDEQCKSVTWLFSHSDKTTTLFEDGKIKANSDQLYVTSDCSLNIKTVSLEDAGLYTCRLFRSGQQHGEDTVYDLSVVDSKDTKPATIKPTTTTTIKSTSKRTSTSKTTTTTTTTKATSTKAGTNTSATATNNPPTKQVWTWWWWVIIASVGSAVLITAAVLIRWKRAKGKRTPMDENMADSADGVCYASISYSKTTNSNAQVQDKDDDEDDAVTYSTVKASSSSAGASADPSDLYATVNKPKR
ncbi:uncharacterized protein LOC144466543 [Epinephelus lanceolatus]